MDTFFDLQNNYAGVLEMVKKGHRRSSKVKIRTVQFLFNFDSKYLSLVNILRRLIFFGSKTQSLKNLPVSEYLQVIDISSQN